MRLAIRGPLEMGASRAAAAGRGRNAQEVLEHPGELSWIQPSWDRGRRALLRAPRNKSGAERGNGCAGHPGIPPSGLKRDVIPLLEKMPSPPPWGVFLSGSRGRERYVYLNNINSLSSTYSLITRDPSAQTKCKISMMLFLWVEVLFINFIYLFFICLFVLHLHVLFFPH